MGFSFIHLINLSLKTLRVFKALCVNILFLLKLLPTNFTCHPFYSSYSYDICLRVIFFSF